MKRQLVFLAFFGLLPLATTAQAEFVLDMSFGTHGIVTNPTAYKVTALAIQQDGKILTVEKNYFGSQRFLIRRNQDGSLDTSFGENGSRMITVEGQNAAHLEITDILIRPDEKIIACGRYNAGQHTTRTLLIQYNSDGTVDEAFHARPLRCTGRERYTLQSDRKIVSVKYSGADVILMRHNEDGSIDSSFGGHGARKFLLHLEHDFLESGDIEPCPAVQSDGKVIVITKQNALNFPIFRYHDDGSLDRSFGAEGTISFTTYLGHPLLNAYLLADDKIMFLTGDPRNANLRHVNCRTRNGLPDTEWSAEGAATITLPFPLHITCSAIQGNGDIILGGFDRKNPDSHARLFRYRKLNALEEAEREAQETIVRGEQALKSWWTSLMHIESDEICPICQDELAIKTIVETPCNHFFHRECLEGWLANDQHTCPMCRENFGDWRLPAE